MADLATTQFAECFLVAWQIDVLRRISTRSQIVNMENENVLIKLFSLFESFIQQVKFLGDFLLTTYQREVHNNSECFSRTVTIARRAG